VFRTVPLSIIRSVSLYTQQWCMSYRFADSLRAGSGRSCMTYTTAVCVQWKIPDDGQRNCPKRVEFYSKNQFEKLVHLVGFFNKNIVLTLYLHTLVGLKWRSRISSPGFVFSLRCCWRLSRLKMWRFVVSRLFPDVSEEYSAFIVRAKHWKKISFFFLCVLGLASSW